MLVLCQRFKSSNSLLFFHLQASSNHKRNYLLSHIHMSYILLAYETAYKIRGLLS